MANFLGNIRTVALNAAFKAASEGAGLGHLFLRICGTRKPF